MAALLVLLAAAIVYPFLQVLSVAVLDSGWPTARPLLVRRSTAAQFRS